MQIKRKRALVNESFGFYCAKVNLDNKFIKLPFWLCKRERNANSFEDSLGSEGFIITVGFTVVPENIGKGVVFLRDNGLVGNQLREEVRERFGLEAKMIEQLLVFEDIFVCYFEWVQNLQLMIEDEKVESVTLYAESSSLICVLRIRLYFSRCSVFRESQFIWEISEKKKKLKIWKFFTNFHFRKWNLKGLA